MGIIVSQWRNNFIFVVFDSNSLRFWCCFFWSYLVNIHIILNVETFVNWLCLEVVWFILLISRRVNVFWGFVLPVSHLFGWRVVSLGLRLNFIGLFFLIGIISESTLLLNTISRYYLTLLYGNLNSVLWSS